MTTMQRDPIKISWDELRSDKVTAKLQRLDAVSKARDHYDNSQVKTREAAPSKFAFLYNTIVYMSLFGTIGGVLGFGFGEIMKFFLPNQRMESVTLIAEHKEMADLLTARPGDTKIAGALKEMERPARRNQYFAIYLDPNLSQDQKDTQTAQLAERDAWKEFIANVLFFGISGMMIATALSSAESIVSRNARGAILEGSVGAALGLVGGIVLSVVYDRLYRGIVSGVDGASTYEMEILAQSVTWGILGLFLAAAPGIMLRNPKRLTIGMIGGLVGGLVGGALYEPIKRQFGEYGGEHLSRAVAIITIGLLSGFGTGLLENVVKSGWIKVKEGLIAGKQFVLYRNPTYIGSAPNCHVYLFKDARVGRRHAAIHVVPGGFEIEDLPLGDRTQVNGRTVTRTRLKGGDKIQVGATVFEFHEKARK